MTLFIGDADRFAESLLEYLGFYYDPRDEVFVYSGAKYVTGYVMREAIDNARSHA